MGVVAFPVRSMGFIAISMRPLSRDRCPGRHLRSNSSQKGSECGVLCRRMMSRTVLSFILSSLSAMCVRFPLFRTIAPLPVNSLSIESRILEARIAKSLACCRRSVRYQKSGCLTMSSHRRLSSSQGRGKLRASANASRVIPFPRFDKKFAISRISFIG